MPKIEVKGITKIFGKKPASVLPLLQAGETRAQIHKKTRHLVAVNQVDFSVNEGDVTVIIGLSGSGKSTLLRCLNRLIEPTAGTVLVGGVNICALTQPELRAFRQKKFGMVFQQFALMPHYSVLRNAAFGLELAGLGRAEREKKAMEALARVGLERWAHSRPRDLSGGMQQRVGLARALALDPEILLMDEAFSALDPLTRRKMQDELLRLQHDLHKTIIFISHDLDEALTLGDRVILMRDGAVLQEGTAEDILSNPADDHVAGFVQYADRSQVLTAGSVMVPAESVAVLGLDGPHTVLRKMYSRNISTLLVLDAFHILLGIVREDDVLRLKMAGKRDLTEILEKDVHFADTSTPLSQIIGIMANLPYPLPVVDARRRLQGVIVRGVLLEALDGSGGAQGQNGAAGPQPVPGAEEDSP